MVFAGVFLAPDIAVRRRIARGQPFVGAVGDALGAPDVRQPVHTFAAEVPGIGADLGHRRVHRVNVHLAHVKGFQQLQRTPLQRAVVGGRHDIEALALGGLHLVDDFLIGADAGVIHLDTGLSLKAGDELRRQVVRPHQDVDFSRRRQRAFRIKRRRQSRSACTLQQRTA